MFVQSKFRAKWKGIVLDKKNRTKYSPLYLVLVIRDSSGKIPRKRIVKILDSSWTKEIDKIDISNINKDWFTEIPIYFKD